jgi:AMMECR1 domain-containing protein
MIRRTRREKAIEREKADLIRWARTQMAQHLDGSRSSQDEDLFLGDMTVGEYFTLSDLEREGIWKEMYTTAIESAPEGEVKLDV